MHAVRGEAEVCVGGEVSPTWGVPHPSEAVVPLPPAADTLRDVTNPEARERESLVDALAVPGSEGAARELEGITRDTGQWRRLVDELANRASTEPNPERKVALLENAIRWCRSELDDPARAEPLLVELFKIDPSHPLVHRRKASLYREQGLWEAQRDSLEFALLRATDDADRRAIHLPLAELYEVRAKNLAKATEHYEAALATDPSCMKALEGLERLARAAERWADLVPLLGCQVNAARAAEERVGALLRLAELLESTFLRPQEAAPKYRRVLEIDPDHAGAFDGLERCHRALREWHELARLLERRAARAPAIRVEALLRAAEVYETQVCDPMAAMAAYRRVHEIDEDHEGALTELARLSERAKDWPAAAVYRAELARLTDDARGKARIFVQIGDMLAEGDRDPAYARAQYERATELDPANIAAWEALQRLASRSGDNLFAAFCLEQRARHTESTRVKSMLLVELGRLRARLGDSRGAYAAFDQALEVEPSNEDAAGETLDEYVRSQRWERAQAACDLLLGAASRAGDGSRVVSLLRLSARVATALCNQERALLATLAAYDLAPADPAVRADVVDACHGSSPEAAGYARACEIVETVLADSDDVPPGRLAKIAEIRRSRGDDAGAMDLLLRAVDRDPENRAVLEALADLSFAREDWERACDTKRRLAQTTRNHDERHALHVETAEIWLDKAGLPLKAIGALEEALALRPTDLGALHRILKIAGDLQLWDKVARTLRRLADLEEDASQRAKQLFAMAQVLDTKLEDGRGAAMVFEEVLAIDPSRLDAFEHVVRILTGAHEWHALERAYKAMLTRLDERPSSRKVVRLRPAAADASARENPAALRHALHYQLGLVYRDRLGDLPRALDEFRTVMRLRPDDDAGRHILNELYVIGAQLPEAVRDTRAALRRDPFRPAVYRELYELFLRQNRVDQAWCAANVLAHLEEVGEVEARFLNDFRPTPLDRVPCTLAPAAYRSHVLHPELDPRLTEILRIVAPALQRLRYASVPESRRATCLGPLLDATGSVAAMRIAAAVGNAAEILGMSVPELHARADLPTPFAIAPGPYPALFVSMPVAEGIPADLLPFIVTRRIAELRPELAAHALFPTVTELKAGLKLAVRAAMSREDGSAGRDEAILARSLDPRELRTLREAVGSVVGGRQKLDLKRWLALADATLSRMGLLMTGDVDVALRAIQRETRSPGDMALDDWKKELFTFAVSDEYADLRAAIGVSVDLAAGV